MKPVVKWAGGKRYLAKEILEVLPDRGRLVEPFVGSGAVSLESDYKNLWWNDSAKPLMTMYRAIRRSPHEVMVCLEILRKKFDSEAGYYDVRVRFNEMVAVDDDTYIFDVASHLIYLNKMGYNGLYRTNKGGGYNVPWGKRLSVDVRWPTEPELDQLANRLKDATLSSSDFTTVLSIVDDNDVVYCDPPYLPLKSGGYTGYVGEFTYEMHQCLAESAVSAANNGAIVLISNHDSKQARELYKDADRIFTVQAPRSISRCGSDRKKVKEVFVFYGR